MRSGILVFLVSTWAAAAMAQAKATRPVGDAIPLPASRCTITTTDVEGLIDNFGGGTEPTTPSPALAAFLATIPPLSQYDQPGCDKHFGESFHLCTCETCGARLEIRVRKCGTAPTQQNNDGYTVGVAPFAPAQKAAQGLVWAAGDPSTKTLVIALTPQQLQVLCANHTTDLDVYIQDDTIVDWMRLTVQHP